MVAFLLYVYINFTDATILSTQFKKNDQKIYVITHVLYTYVYVHSENFAIKKGDIRLLHCMDDDVRSLSYPLQTIHWSISQLFHIFTLTRF